jgi:hypothetical protein
MKISKLHDFLVARYERLFTRRFRLENERDVDAYPAVSVPRRRRFSIVGAIFPTESILSRYQY